MAEEKGMTLPAQEEMLEEDARMHEDIGEMSGIRDLKLDLDKDEKIRVVALLLGTRFYVQTIIKDAAYLDRMIKYEEDRERARLNDPNRVPFHLHPANIRGVIGAAYEMELFLRGKHSVFASMRLGEEELGGIAKGNVEDETETEASEQGQDAGQDARGHEKP